MTSEIFSESFSLWVFVWQSTVLTVAGLAASFILRRRSSRAHQVLLLAMLAAVIVPVASVLVKRFELGVFAARPAAVESQGDRPVSADNHKAAGIVAAADIEHEPAAFGEVTSSSPSVSSVAKLPWWPAALCVWVAASAVLTMRLLVSFVLGVHLLGRAMPFRCDRIEQAMRLAKTKLEISRDVQVLSSPDVRGPVIWCWRRRPALLVPSAAVQSNIDWTSILCHELAHWKRWDHVSGLIGELAVCILPWHLLLWLAKSRLAHLSEQACDDWVIATDQSSTDYAESLLNLAPGGQMAFVPAVVSSKKSLAGRVHRILQDQCANPHSGLRWRLAVTLITGCVAVGIAFAQTRDSVQPGAAWGKDVPSTTLMEPEKPEDIKTQVITLRLVDSDGRPVSGAKVGTHVNTTRDVSVLGSRLSWSLPSRENNVSNERGEIKLTLEKLFPAGWSPDRKVALYVLHEDQKIGAVCEISRDSRQQEIKLALEPVCHVHGRLSSEALERIDRPLNLTHVYMYWDRDSFGVLTQTCHNAKEYKFDFLVPPGRYELDAYGYGEGTNTESAKPKVMVKAGQAELDMGVIDLPPTKLTMLIGKPAPELGPIKAWKNGSPTRLADLRGKPVILHFGGGHPSTNRDLPKLTALHQEFSKAGLVVIGLYNCESMKQLEERFREGSEKHGGDPDVPFRLAVDGGRGRGVEGTNSQMPGDTYAAYDIKAYTTTVLIDLEGKVAETLNLNGAREKLESMLGVKAESERHAWKQRFEQVYRLDEGQILKRIAPPFIPERKDYCAKESPDPRRPEGPATMVLHWRDSQANLSYTLDRRSLSLSNLIQYVLDIGSPNLWWIESKDHIGNPEGPEQLLGMELPGDWILRDDTPAEARMRAVEKLVAEEFGRHIRIQKRTVERDVIIATGQFKFSPVYSEEMIVMFADEDESVRKKGETVYSGANTVSEFLQHLAWLVSVPVIDKTQIADDTRIEYRAHLSQPSLRHVANLPEKRDKLRFLLDTLSRQTNLQFGITREPVEMWSVTEGEQT